MKKPDREQKRSRISSCTEKAVIVIPQQRSQVDLRIPAAVFCRVSTRSENQRDSLENQIVHYQRTVGEDPRYELYKIYYDFGISGFKENRPGFRQMMKDAEEGRFRLVITKVITRFARNTLVDRREDYLPEWERMATQGDALKRYYSWFMITATAEGLQEEEQRD